MALKKIIDIEYADLSTDSIIFRGKLRVFVKDGSFVDVWFSLKVPGRFSYHWERRHIDGTMYRHDNFPDVNWQRISTSTYPSTFITALRLKSRRAISMTILVQVCASSWNSLRIRLASTGR